MTRETEQKLAPAVTLAEAKLFLRVESDTGDAAIQTMAEAAQERVEASTGVDVHQTSPAPLRLAILMLVLRQYERGEEAPLSVVEPWIAPYRVETVQ